MKSLSRSDILSVIDLPSEQVEVPEWDGCVFVRGMTGQERETFEQSIIDMKGQSMTVIMENVRAKLVAICTVDEEGKSLFSQEDVKALSDKSAVALNRVFEVAQRLSGMADNAVGAAKIELKNPKRGSTSSSR